MKKQLLLLFVLGCLLSFSQTPKTKDSLIVYLRTHAKDTNYVYALNDFAFIKVQEGNMAEVHKIISQMESLSKKLNFGLGYYKVENMRGIVEYSNQNPQKAMAYFMKCKAIIQKYKLPKKNYQNWLNSVSIIYDQLGDRTNATKYSMELINFQEKNKLVPYKTNPYQQLANNLKFYKKYKESLTYYNKALALEKEYKNYTGMAVVENNLGNLYDDMENIPVAIQHYEAGLKAAEAADYKLLQNDFFINLGRMHRHQNNFEKAENYFRKSIAICKELEVTKPLKITYQALGDMYFFQKKYTLSEVNYLKSLEIASTIEDFESSYTVSQNLADLYEMTADFKKAFYFKTKADALKDSITKMDIAENTEDLLRKYEAGKKEQQIAIKNIQINNAKKQQWYFIGGILLLGIIGSLLFYQSRNRRKTNEKLQLLNTELDQANKAKTRFFSILNHDLRGPVANLIFFLQLQKESPEMLDEESTKRMQDKTMEGAENLLNSMEDILQWSKSQMENFKPQPQNLLISDLFDDIQKHFLSVENINLRFENPDNLTLITDENYLKTILRNLTANAIKALTGIQDPLIIWRAFHENGQTILTITDNGKGASQEEFKALYDEKEVSGIKTGLGLHLIRDLAKAINCEIVVQSNTQSGTTFTLKL